MYLALLFLHASMAIIFLIHVYYLIGGYFKTDQAMLELRYRFVDKVVSFFPVYQMKRW